MSDAPKKSKRLHFKGDPKPKKKKKKVKTEAEDDDLDDASLDSSAWVPALKSLHVTGPTFIQFISPPSVITYNSTLNKPILSLLPPPPAGGSDAPAPSYEPDDVCQVWVATRLSGSEKITLRSADGKFLASDQHGLVSAEREARGPQEEWTPVEQPDGTFAFQSVYDKFLGMDEVAGGGLVLRADSEAVGFAESWVVKVQAKFRRQAERAGRESHQRSVEGVGGGVLLNEVDQTAKFQTWGAGRRIVSQEDERELKKARKEGRLAEAMLDRRAKLKSDKFAK